MLVKKKNILLAMLSTVPAAWSPPGLRLSHGTSIHHKPLLSRRRKENFNLLSQFSMRGESKRLDGEPRKNQPKWRLWVPKVLASLLIMASVLFPSPRTARAGASLTWRLEAAQVEKSYNKEEHPPWLTIKGLRRASDRVLFFVGDSGSGNLPTHG
jgi:hypothetical protein